MIKSNEYTKLSRSCCVKVLKKHTMNKLAWSTVRFYFRREPSIPRWAKSYLISAGWWHETGIKKTDVL